MEAVQKSNDVEIMKTKNFIYYTIGQIQCHLVKQNI